MQSGSGQNSRGQGFAGYDLLRVVAQDRWGTVYEAAVADGPHRLALRVLPPCAAAPDLEEVGWLRAGARAAARLAHPGAATIHEVGCHEQSAFVAIPWVEGDTLPKYLARAGRLPVFQGLALAAQLLSTLEAAHRVGLVHGAIDPDLLLVSRTGRLQVTGFGWAAPAASRVQPPAGGAMPWAAPEQLDGRPGDARSDLYSAGVIAYHLLTGAWPFGADPGAQRPALRSPLPVHASRPELPAGLDGVFRRVLAPDPAARDLDAHAFGAALLAALGAPVWAGSRAPAGPVRVRAAVGPPVPPAVPIFRAPDVAARGSWSGRGRRIGWALALGCAVGLFQAINSLVGPPAATAAASIARQGAKPPEHPPIPAAKPTSDLPVQLASAGPAPAEAPAADPPATLALQGRRPATTGQETPAVRPAPAVRASRDDVRSASARTAGPVARQQRHASERHPARRARVPRPDSGCGADPGFARELCTALRCATAEYRPHPICVRMHADGLARQQLAEALGGR